jgi:uncharacterized damage-inducible protein DinB
MNDEALGVTALFLRFSRGKLVDQYWPRLRGCVESLSEEQVWWRPNENSNSVGNLVLHLSGNVRQWLITSFTAQKDARQRSTEFAEREHIPIPELLRRLESTIQEASALLERLTEEDLQRSFTVQGYSVTGLDAVYHVVEHFAMHYGQILYVTKLVRGEDLGFYQHLNKTGRAS